MLVAAALALLLQQSAEETFPKGGGAAFVAQIRGEIDKCGLTARPFAVADEDIYEPIVVTLERDDLSDVEVECLANNPELDMVAFDFSDDRIIALYHDTLSPRPDVQAAIADSIERQRAWLDERGLLVGMPVFDPEQPLSTYSAAVETHCGAQPRSILIPDDARRSLSVSADRTFDDKVACVFGILSLAIVEETAPSILITGEDHAS